jgi:hypothetical protein
MDLRQIRILMQRDAWFSMESLPSQITLPGAVYGLGSNRFTPCLPPIEA